MATFMAIASVDNECFFNYICEHSTTTDLEQGCSETGLKAISSVAVPLMLCSSSADAL